jgi:hypothetical protein
MRGTTLPLMLHKHLLRVSTIIQREPPRPTTAIQHTNALTLEVTPHFRLQYVAAWWSAD